MRISNLARPVVALALLALAEACGKDLRADLDRLTESRLLVADLSVQVERWTAAADRAVMTPLAGLASPDSAAHMTAARRALDRFLDVHAQVLSLSRRNSNVQAVTTSLGQARLLAAACEESLRALGDALTQRTDRATR